MARKRGEQPWVLVLAFRDERGNTVHCLKYWRRPAGRERNRHVHLCVVVLGCSLRLSSACSRPDATHCLVLISRGGEGGGGGGGSGQNKDNQRGQLAVAVHHNAKILKAAMDIYPTPEFLCHYSTSSSRLNLTMVSCCNNIRVL